MVITPGSLGTHDLAGNRNDRFKEGSFHVSSHFAQLCPDWDLLRAMRLALSAQDANGGVCRSG
jgi:predicted transcriptional regulator